MRCIPPRTRYSSRMLLPGSPNRFRLLFVCLAAGLLLSACGDDDTPPTTDAGLPPSDAGQPMDAGPELSYLFGPCTANEQCPGEDGICRRGAEGYAQGQCTRPCSDRTPCDDGVYHHCVVGEDGQGFCAQRCLNGADCGRSSYTCVGELPPSGGVCQTRCQVGECGEGAECNPWSGACGPVGSAPTTGGVAGEPCADPSECRSGICAGGWPGGYCVGSCRLPAGFNSSTFWAEDELPRGTCADPTDVCLPEESTARGDLGNCFRGCTDDTECRSGYTCFRTFNLQSGPRTFSRGFCRPVQ